MSYFSVKDFATGLAQKILGFVVNTDQLIPAHVLVDSSGAERTVLKIKPGSAAATVFVSLTTNATGTNYTAFGSQVASTLTIDNTRSDAVPLEIRNVSSTTPTHQIPVGGTVLLNCAANCNEWEVRRLDTSNTTVVVQGMAN